MWIRSDASLRSHPKLHKAAFLLGIDPILLIGHLQCLWWWATEYAPEGDITTFTTQEIALGAGWPSDPDGFVEALVSARIGGRWGFIEEHKNGKRLLHDWFEHAGRYIVRRRTDTERKRMEREADPHQPPTEEKNGTEYPRQIEVFLEQGGKFPAGRVNDGTTRKQRAIEYICERVATDEKSLELWARVVKGYARQWSPTSYTVMVTEYYEVGRVPGERKRANGSTNGSTGFAFDGRARTAADIAWETAGAAQANPF